MTTQLHTGVVPYGYKRGPLALEKEPYEQAVIGEVRRLNKIVDNHAEVARRINALGFRSRAGTPFLTSQVRRMLRAPFERLGDKTALPSGEADLLDLLMLGWDEICDSAAGLSSGAALARLRYSHHEQKYPALREALKRATGLPLHSVSAAKLGRLLSRYHRVPRNGRCFIWERSTHANVWRIVPVDIQTNHASETSVAPPQDDATPAAPEPSERIVVYIDRNTQQGARASDGTSDVDLVTIRVALVRGQVTPEVVLAEARPMTREETSGWTLAKKKLYSPVSIKEPEHD